MKVLWASSWGVFAALTDAVHSPHHQCFGKNKQSNCATWADPFLSLPSSSWRRLLPGLLLRFCTRHPHGSGNIKFV